MLHLDAAGLFACPLPLGLGPNPAASTLTTVEFTHFEHQDATLTVRVMPAMAGSPQVTAADWLQGLQEQFSSATWRLLPSQPGMTTQAAGEGRPEGGFGLDRWRMLRGPRLDVILLHTAQEDLAPGTPSAWLDSVAAAIQVPANRRTAHLAPGEDFTPHLLAAREAIRQQSWQAAVLPAVRAVVLAEQTLAASLYATPFLEVGAAFAMAQAKLFLSQALGDWRLLREAESIAMRTINILEDLTFLSETRREQLTQQFAGFLDYLGRMQAHMYPAEAEMLQQRDLAKRAQARAKGCLALARKRLAQQYPAQALQYTELAVQDQCTAMAWSARYPTSQPLPEATIERFQLAILPPADQVQEFRQLMARLGDIELQEYLTFLYSQCAQTGDAPRALEVSALLLSVSRRLATRQEVPSGGALLPPDGQDLLLARSLIIHAMAREGLGDEQTLAETWPLLQAAERLLDTAADEGALRAWLCRAMAANRYGRCLLDGGLEIIARGLAACAQAPGETARYRRELLTLQAQFLELHGAQNAAPQAAEAAAQAGTDVAVHSSALATYDLLAALTCERAGEPEQALAHLRRGLWQAVTTEPLTALVCRLLQVAATCLPPGQPAMAAELASAALRSATLLQAQEDNTAGRPLSGAGIPWQEMHDRLVASLASTDTTATLALMAPLGSETLYGLGQLPALAERQQADHAEPAVAALLADLLPQPHTNAALGLAQPVLDMLDAGAACVQAARYVQEVVNATRQQHGLPAALSGPEIEALAATTGSTLLLVHPLPDRTLLAVTHGPGRTALRWSAVGRDALATLVAQCWAALDSHQAPRAAGEAGTMSADAEVLDAALRDLYQGLIAPVADQLAPARPLCMVPYHALTWLPWHMLTDEAGKYLFERLPLTVMPSVALWAALHADPAETGLAQSAYIVAAPATEPTWNLARLPETVAEARDIATLLTAHGIADAAVRVRTDTDATVPSYASEAAQADIVHLGCHGELGPVAEVSRLFLTPVEGSDGVLLANDMPAVHLGRGLVFLAACKRTEGWPTVDGVMGLSAAFWRAGARCVVLSLWQANAQARQLLLHHFYEALLDPLRPVSIAVALQTAMLATRTALLAGGIRAPDGTVISAHPVHWAPFIVLGDPMGYGSPGPDDSTQTLSSYGA